MPALNIVFAGTPQFAAEHLSALLDSSHHVSAVLTQPDRPAGRGKKLRPGPVKMLAEAHQIPVYQPETLDEESARTLLEPLSPDVLVVVAYGLLLPPAVLALPRYGCLNIHASLLPRWRGAAPVERAILDDDKLTGVTLMQMDSGLDTGDILLQQETTIHPTDTGATLADRLSQLGGELLCRGLDQLAEQGSLTATPQKAASSTYAAKLRKGEAAVDWHQPANVIRRQIQALSPRMPAYTYLHGERVRLLSATEVSTNFQQSTSAVSPGCIISASPAEGLVVRCGDSSISLQAVQLAGKKPVDIAALLNAHRQRFAAGQCFQSAP